MSPNSLTRGLASTLPSSGISLPSNLTNGHLPEQEPSDANHNLIGKSQENNRDSTQKPGIIQKILKNLPWETDKVVVFFFLIWFFERKYRNLTK